MAFFLLAKTATMVRADLRPLQGPTLFRNRRLFPFALVMVLAFQPLVAACCALPAFAQEVVPARDDVVESVSAQIAEAEKALGVVEGQVEERKNDDAALVDIKVKADELIRQLLKISVELRPRFNDVKARLAQLGEKPAEGEPEEAPAVTEERNRLNATRLEINTLTGRAEDLSIRASNLSDTITDLRRQLFTERLFEHTEISGDVLDDAINVFSSELSDFNRTVSSWFSFIWKFKRVPLGTAVMLSLAMALVLLAAEYRLFGSLIRRDPAESNPSYMSRFSVAFWSTILPALALGAFLVASFFFLDTFNLLRPDIAPIAAALFGFAGLVFFVAMLARAVLAPKAPSWRLVRLSNKGARDLNFAVLSMAVVNGSDYVLGAVSETLSSPVVLTVMKSFISSVIVGLIVFIVSFLRPVLSDSGDPAERGRPWPKTIAISFRVIGIGLILLSAIGYVGLSRFLATQIVLTGAVVATMYIGILSGKAISAPNQFGETRVGRFLQRRFNLKPVGLDQAGIVAGLAIYVFALSIGIPLILISWGFQPRDLEIWLINIFTEINIGTIRISIFGILGGILLFSLGLVATRWLQKWLDGNVMARSQVDAGVRNSVKTGVGYLGTGIAGLIGISAAGIDLSSLALVAGALSLGIGFGLQNIVSNFVSGLILLVERPFKVGDWVATGTTEGFVRRISVRATEIETFQRQSIIVPNSELINAPVGNWTHRNKLGRIEIPVSVSYDSDPRQVMDLLMEIALAHPGLLRNPEPVVLFNGFGASSLDFELRGFIGDVLGALPIRNELRVTILERFRSKGILMPYPHQEVHLHLDEKDRRLFSGRTDARKPGPRTDLRDPPDDDKILP
ncbi:MAG: mechanosensitive ion channel family protein [Alphaproteobacteria bacterium]|nr:mechanosensitive ion channel family protein [Rhizobiaceae bacterium]MBU3960756.1 mechanosensitive ion channel family protein [Alphaproteobacteria bacterium]MBU4049830.1 mechanosensitive ion channel family protein [Alphaproteobacteria bacterium]MBU4090404.1 mechanosensitive ion channel family protein [Alphaproteobacteria bacterium]MBU4155137.1 mechanosensitive ion channel family protein [Alphaproteobacteria bacterium]